MLQVNQLFVLNSTSILSWKNKWFLATALAMGLVACEKETDTFQSDSVRDYTITLQPGKYIRYQLDSTRIVDFGQRDTLVSYQAKDQVDEQITDIQGRPAWRIVRYLRDAASTSESDWRLSFAYYIVPTDTALEVVENNLRFVKLMRPLNNFFSWNGNAYLPEEPYNPAFPFVNDVGIQQWDFTYQDVGATAVVNDVEYPNTVTIVQVDDSLNVPILEPSLLAYRSYSVEQYAKGVGMISRDVILWDYQPGSSGGNGYRTGFGVSMRIIDHN